MTELLFPALAAPGPRPALTVQDTHWTYAALAAACAEHASALHALGLRPGDHVAVWTAAHPSMVVALVGNALAGMVTVALNPALGSKELQHILQDAAPRLLLCPPGHAPVGQSLPQASLPLRAHGASRLLPERAVDDAPLLVLYTSGTTGLPKGAVLTARNVAANLDALARAWTWSADDQLVHALPLFHVHGLVLGLFGSLRRGASLRWLPKFSPESWAQALEHGGTMGFGVPTMYHRVAELLEQEPSWGAAFRRARVLISGSAPLPVREHDRLLRSAGLRVLERYGLTETLINTAVCVGDPPAPGTVGRALEGVELRLVDDARRVLPETSSDTPGEVAVRGANVFPGYLNRPDASAAVRDPEGWFYTGDLATRDAGGALRIVGRRATDLIKTGGFKVGAGEVEAALLEHPAVREAAVLGCEDADLGERIVAYLVLREGSPVPEPGTLQAHVAALLSAHKRPRELHFLSELPRNAMGKVLKAKLREHRA